MLALNAPYTMPNVKMLVFRFGSSLYMLLLSPAFLVGDNVYACICVCVPVCLSVCLSVCPSIRLYQHISRTLRISRRHILIFFYRNCVCVWACLSVRLSVYPSVTNISYFNFLLQEWSFIQGEELIYFGSKVNSRWQTDCNTSTKPLLGHNFIVDWDIDLKIFYG